jgi:hypothetical protein
MPFMGDCPPLANAGVYEKRANLRRSFTDFAWGVSAQKRFDMSERESSGAELFLTIIP